MKSTLHSFQKWERTIISYHILNLTDQFWMIKNLHTQCSFLFNIPKLSFQWPLMTSYCLCRYSSCLSHWSQFLCTLFCKTSHGSAVPLAMLRMALLLLDKLRENSSQVNIVSVSFWRWQSLCLQLIWQFTCHFSPV